MKKKTLALLLSLVLVFGVIAGGTIAWLTANSKTITNTFTYGDITIDLNETTTGYKVVPGATDEKDPTITIDSASEKCYVYVKVENTLKADNEVVATTDMKEEDWILVGQNGDVKLYRYKEPVTPNGKDVTLKVFEHVTYSSDKITKENIQTVAAGKIIITAYAHQYDNTTITNADTSACTWAGVTAVTAGN